ncbi:MAG: hypothetical protein A2X86_14815 [Bdellovibrionales bacterium GWA2_49_15]|nr:MAG: hypothetical protein A2X86_14815 [Bdellovibrionales bacterium GWA2_49_15]
MNLGNARAQNVRTYLIAKQIDPAKLLTVSWGKERPVHPNCAGDDACHGKNRRANFQLVTP